MLGTMQINSSQTTSGASLFQALHSGPTAPASATGGRPVAQTQEQAAVQAGQASDKPDAHEDEGRGQRRGSRLDVKV